MVNRQRRNPGELARFEATARVSGDVPSFAVNTTGSIFDALTSVAGTLSGQLGQLADKARAREGENDLLRLLQGQDGAQSAVAHLRQQAVQNDAHAAIPAGPAEEQAKALLRKEEGFRDSPYWDTNAHRVGYGSDTITRADGTQAKVTRGMKITREDAERDLDYRLRDREGKQVREQLGDSWSKLPANAQAALYSVGYNYGSLPSAVVKAAKTGDLQAISSAVRALPANSKRRGVEADLILSGKPVTQPSTEGRTISADGVPVLSTAPIALRRDGTIYGDAFDAAATRAIAWRMQQNLTTELTAAFDQHKDDPAAFNKAVSDVKAKFLEDDNFGDPKLREIFEQSFAEKTEGYYKEVANRQEIQLRQEEQASFAGAFEAQNIELERQTMALGASKDGDAIAAKRLGSMIAGVDRAERDGTISPLKAAELRESAQKTAVRGRFIGVFDALPTPTEKQEFALGILEDWKDGKGPIAKLPYEEVRALSSTLHARATRLTGEEKAALSAEKGRLKGVIADDVASITTTGQGLDAKENNLDAEHVENVLGPVAAAKWKEDRELAQKTYSATADLERQTPDDMAARLDMLEPKPGTVGFADQQKMYAIVKQRSVKVLADRIKDPLAAANKAGVIALQPIDTTDEQTMAASLDARAKQADQVKEIFEIDTPLFTDQEQKVLKAGLGSNDPPKYQAMMQQLDFLANHSGLDAVKAQFGDKGLDALQDWQAKAKFLSTDEIAGWLKDKSDPAFVERTKPLRTKGLTEARKIAPADVVAAFDESYFSDPGAPVDRDTSNALSNDFVQLMADSYVTTQDADAAKTMAVEKLKRVWGVTSLLGDGGGRLMAFPPEKYHVPIAGSYDWMRDELADIAKANAIAPERMTLVADQKTKNAVDRKEQPGYLIAVQDPATGETDLLRDKKGNVLRQFFDPKAVVEKADARMQEQRVAPDNAMTLMGLSGYTGDPMQLMTEDQKAAFRKKPTAAEEVIDDRLKAYKARRAKLLQSGEELDRLGVPGGR